MRMSDSYRRDHGSRSSLSSPPLRQNRDFLLLQTGQLLSESGTQIALIAYPLLVLSLTGSATQAGIAGFARLLSTAVFALPAGLVADRRNRKRVMIASDILRFATIAALAFAIVNGRLVFWMIPLAAFLEGTGTSFFRAAQSGALRAVVPATQLPAAINVVTGRQAAINIAGPPIGGALFGVARSVPFVVDAISYALSTLSLLVMRTPFQEERDGERQRLREQLLEGFRFLWGLPFLRTTTLVFAPLGFVPISYTLAVVVIAEEQGLSGFAVGALVASFGAGILVGSAISPQIRRTLPARAVLLLELWMWTVPFVFLVWPNVYVLAVSLLPAALAVPSTDSVVVGYQLALTPDRLVGRVDSIVTTISIAVAPLGPLLAGFLLGETSPRITVACFVVVTLLVAVVATLSSTLRSPPSIVDRSSETAPELVT
jgi:predicted MFS family arabinose efflux permease